VNRTMLSRATLSRAFGWTALAAGLALLTPLGCGSVYTDRCDAICDCESCGDRQREECDLATLAEADVAAAYDCVELLDDYFECQLQEYECKDNEYRDDNDNCRREWQEYRECKDARSSREPGPY
jgi:hypothetical protein